MLVAFLFLAELFLLFLLSRELTAQLSQFFYTVTKSKRLTIHILAFLFFPGTVLHEISHALVAGLSGVPVGKIEFVPVIHDDFVKLGSVQIGKTDFFRRFLIGAAPFFIGTSLLLGILYFLTKNHLLDNYLLIFLTGYVIFEIGNTMFSSRKDMEGAIELLVTILLLGIVFYLLGVRFPAVKIEDFFNQPLIKNTLSKGSLFLLVPLILDCCVIGLLRFTKRIG